ncbi:MAG: hypothetical protein QXN68_02150 [Thermoplasmata archaeon]
MFVECFYDNLDSIMDAIIIYASGKAVGMTSDELRQLYYTYRISLSSREESIFLLIKHISFKSGITILRLVKIIVNIVYRTLTGKCDLCVSKRRLSKIIMNYLKNLGND